MGSSIKRVEIDGITHHRDTDEGSVTRCNIPFLFSTLPWDIPWRQAVERDESVPVDCMTCLVLETR